MTMQGHQQVAQHVQQSLQQLQQLSFHLPPDPAPEGGEAGGDGASQSFLLAEQAAAGTGLISIDGVGRSAL